MSANFLNYHLFWIAVLLSLFVSPANGSGIRVEALNCEFTIPNEYITQIGEGSTEFYTRAPHEYGRVSFQSLSDENAQPETSAKQMESKAIGHLKVIRYMVQSKDGSRAQSYVVVKGLTDKLILTGQAANLADSIASECVATTPPAVLEVAKRRERGCPMLARRDFEAFFSQMRPQPVFRNAGIAGWRVYERDQQNVLSSLGLRSSDLITHVCGVSMSETFEVKGDICCVTPVAATIDLLIERNGRTEKIAAPMPNKSPQPIAPKRAPAER